MLKFEISLPDRKDFSRHKNIPANQEELFCFNSAYNFIINICLWVFFVGISIFVGGFGTFMYEMKSNYEDPVAYWPQDLDQWIHLGLIGFFGFLQQITFFSKYSYIKYGALEVVRINGAKKGSPVQVKLQKVVPKGPTWFSKGVP